MKTKIFTFSLLLASSSLFAQWQTNGNIALATDYLGTNNNQPLRFHTNGTERMTILGNGNVGIGVGSPQAPLNIAGSGNLTSFGWKRGLLMSDGGAIIFDKNAIGADNYFFMAHPSSGGFGDFWMGLTPALARLPQDVL
jgi:hypothetical protein